MLCTWRGDPIDKFTLLKIVSTNMVKVKSFPNLLPTFISMLSGMSLFPTGKEVLPRMRIPQFLPLFLWEDSPLQVQCQPKLPISFGSMLLYRWYLDLLHHLLAVSLFLEVGTLLIIQCHFCNLMAYLTNFTFLIHV